MAINDHDKAARPADRAGGAAGAGPVPGSEAYGRWVEQMQRSRGRHAAITRNLYTWSNYKNWADKMRSDWEPDSGK